VYVACQIVNTSQSVAPLVSRVILCCLCANVQQVKVNKMQ